MQSRALKLAHVEQLRSRGQPDVSGSVRMLADLMSGSSLTTFACREAKLRWLEGTS